MVNFYDIRDEAILKEVEAEITNIKLMRLLVEPIKGDFDLKHLQAIHKFMFEDIYPFAGKIREENIAKDSFRFADYRFVETEAESLFVKLLEENSLLGLTVKDFAARAAYYMAEINVLHPFREGNGRVIREFIRCLASNAGYELDWSAVPKERVLDASIKSVSSTVDLARVIEKSIEVTREHDLER